MESYGWCGPASALPLTPYFNHPVVGEVGGINERTVPFPNLASAFWRTNSLHTPVNITQPTLSFLPLLISWWYCWIRFQRSLPHCLDQKHSFGKEQICDCEERFQVFRWTVLIELSSTSRYNDAQMALDFIIVTFNSIVNVHAPFKKIRIKDRLKPWFTPRTDHLISFEKLSLGTSQKI